jgi:mannitol-1-/sugar-/sorbitol-6-/2-deoxyglucose-6-phosphatase
MVMKRETAGTRQGLQAALFDLDGLLVDSEPLWHVAEIEVFGSHGVPLTAEMCTQTKGRFVSEAVLYWYERYPWESPGTDEVASEILDRVSELIDSRLELKPGARFAIAECERRGLRLAVASSAPQRIIESSLRRFGLDSHFEATCSAEHEHAGKPDPAVFLSAARRLESEPGRCVVFEDSLAGVNAAKRAGMLCVAVPESFAGPDGDRSEFVAADVVLRSLGDLDENVWARLEISAGFIVRAVAPHATPDYGPIVVEPGEEVSVGERSREWPAFVSVTTGDGKKGWVPERLLEKTDEGEGAKRRARDGGHYDTTELRVEPGAELLVVEPDLGSGWLWCRDSAGNEGWIPVGCIQVPALSPGEVVDPH